MKLVKSSGQERDVPRGVVGGAEISQATTGAHNIYMGIFRVPAGSRGRPHSHDNCESARYMLSGAIEIRFGDKLQESLTVVAGDLLYVPNSGHGLEDRERVAAAVSGQQFGQELEERAVLLATGRGDGERALGEPLTVIGAGAVRELSVDDGAAERALGGVVGRLDPLDRDEGPERGPDFEQVVGEPSVVAGALALAAGVLQQGSQR